jgi:hypothetical protein
LGSQIPEDWVEEVAQATGAPEAGRRARRAKKKINIERLKNMIVFEVMF